MKILLVSIAFPPKLDPECIQTAKYFKYLSQNENLTFQVITSDTPTLFMPVDENLNSFDGVAQIIKVPIYENRYSNVLLRKLNLPLIDKPDSKFSFHHQWKRVLKAVKKPDVIYSRAYPLSSAFMASKLAKYYGVPWVMHLSDPWTQSPYFDFSKKLMRFHKKKERELFEQAYAISFTSQKTVSTYKNCYKEYTDKFLYYPNVYDPDLMNNDSISFNGKLRFVYTGGLAGKRSALTLLNSLKALRKSHADVLDKCEFIFAGDVDRHNLKFFNDFIDPSIKYIGQRSYQEAIDLQRSAHVLLLFEAPIEDKKFLMFFPSKLLDYYITRRRIIAVTSPDSTACEFVKENNLGNVVPYNNTGLMSKTILRCFDKFEKEDEGFFQKSGEPIEEFSAKYNSDRLIKLFNEAV